MKGWNNRLYLIDGSLFIAFGVICYLVGRGILIGIKYKKQIYWLKEVISFLFVIYICMVISVTLFPLPIGFHSSIENIYRLRAINVIPFTSIIENIREIGTAYNGDAQFMIRLIIRNVGGNILLLMPLGFLAPILSNRFKCFKNSVFLGLVVSISIELLQLIESLAGGFGRITDIDDVICNVLGVIIGYLIYKFIFKIVDKFRIKILQKLNDGSSGFLDKENKVEL